MSDADAKMNLKYSYITLRSSKSFYRIKRESERNSNVLIFMLDIILCQIV